jgi:acetyl-CoA synthetase
MSSIFLAKPEIARNAWCNQEQYHELYSDSIKNPEKFWSWQAQRLDWIEKWHTVKNCSFDQAVHIAWYEGGKLNASYNCIDRHLEKRAELCAIIWEPDDPSEETRYISYQELHDETCRMANILRTHGVRQGDRVTIYLPMIPEAAFAMLACARLGAIHSVVFAGFSPEALAGRIQDCDSRFVITADEGVRGGKITPLKANVDRALDICPQVEKVLVIERTHAVIPWFADRDISYKKIKHEFATTSPYAIMDAEDPLFILYTSGSTGKPKGILHTTGGYLVYAAVTHHYVFDYHEGDIYWCTADVGWVTGHSYIIYGPLANGATTLMFEGMPNHPTPSRHWEIIDKHQVNIYYSSPTAIRSLMQQGDDYVKNTSRQSLKILGVVGEPINPAAWYWYYDIVGEQRCPIVDTWWQTETGGILISPLPGATDLKAGSATLPFFGIEPVIVNEQGHVLQGECEGFLCIKDSWPGQMRTVYKNPERFAQAYFSNYPGLYFSGDGCKRDADGYYWITGRVDDVINVAGHRLSTAEIESALVAHHAVSEAAVVGCPHEIKGQAVYAFVTLTAGFVGTEELKQELLQQVREEISAIAAPDYIQWAPALPKTRSGKIMRRILRKIVEQDLDNLGDTSTLADPTVVEDLIKKSEFNQ